MKKICVFSILIFTYIIGFPVFSSRENTGSEVPQKGKITSETYTKKELGWAESKLKDMSLEEKIAQLIMIRIHSNFSNEYKAEMVARIEKYQVGGVCFFQGGPLRQINLTNRIQAVSKIPLLVSIDGEWGPAMRLDSCIAFPRQITMGALDYQDDSLIYEMGKDVADQCKALGVHINFAPCVDINNNMRNPVINSRSFGEIRELVARKGILYMRGMQDNGISACAKHFPGHGDTGTDSHAALPVISKSYQELDSVELFPFKKLIGEGIDMVMVSHLNVPAFDPGKNSISTLSYNTITMLLKKRLGFDGIICTDAMDMNGLRSHYPHGGDAEIKALLAGIDLLLLPNELDVVIPAIKTAVESGVIPEELIDEKCLKILKFKEQKGLKKFRKIPTEDVIARMNSQNAQAIIENIEKKSLTLVRNSQHVLPLQKDSVSKIALLCIGGVSDSAAYRAMCEDRGIGFVQTDRSIKKGEYARLLNDLSPYSRVVVAMLSTNQSPRYNYGIYQESVSFLNELAFQKKVILSVFANPYALNEFSSISKYPAIVVGYQATPTAVKSTLDALFAEIPFSGRLPVSTKSFKAQTGFCFHDTAIEYRAEDYSVLTKSADKKIDSIINSGIKNKIFPGCQILAIKNGTTAFHKCYGYKTYSKNNKIDAEVLYDVASITKAAGTTLAVMKLYDEKRIKLEDTIGNYLPYLSKSDKANLTLAELLTHTSGLPAFIPFYKELLSDKKWNRAFLNDEPTGQIGIEVAKDVYLLNTYPDTIRKRIADCKLGAKTYVYSDLGFVLLKDMVEKVTGKPVDQYLSETFYQPLGLKHTLYNPLKYFEKGEIAPTEDDKIFRMQLLQGYVHDQTAAMFGGVSGNAGLFSNVYDLAVIFQMLLNGGEYNDVQYISSETVRLFTSVYPINGCSRRALGFDVPSGEKKSPALPSEAGTRTFGHQGFTGTVVWCDPESKLIYLFLSNRVYPNAEPNKLSKSGIRLNVHTAVYKGLGY